MKMRKNLFIAIILFLSVHLFAFDSLVYNEKYFFDAMKKSKLLDYGKNRIIAVLDTGINDNNRELKGKVIAEYDFTTNSPEAIDKDGHGTKMASIIASVNNSCQNRVFSVLDKYRLMK